MGRALVMGWIRGLMLASGAVLMGASLIGLEAGQVAPAAVGAAAAVAAMGTALSWRGWHR